MFGFGSDQNCLEPDLLFLCSLEAKDSERVSARIKPSCGLWSGSALLRLQLLLPVLQTAAQRPAQAPTLQTGETSFHSEDKCSCQCVGRCPSGGIYCFREDKPFYRRSWKPSGSWRFSCYTDSSKIFSTSHEEKILISLDVTSKTVSILQDSNQVRTTCFLQDVTPGTYTIEVQNPTVQLFCTTSTEIYWILLSAWWEGRIKHIKNPAFVNLFFPLNQLRDDSNTSRRQTQYHVSQGETHAHKHTHTPPQQHTCRWIHTQRWTDEQTHTHEHTHTLMSTHPHTHTYTEMNTHT